MISRTYLKSVQP